ncbi:stage III sporulation protein AD [Cellulosilyticum sp. I15G10I2]|uniref:stage III sporulation protein AD n=1 Tax=Cellulosilyticum sp. I15G10I2 TaxID=1892843 RepID=UPI00085CA1F8|nr:stage III sporulation protein AD [Cellulosilyticum sp. I15G10I2]
MEMLKLVSFGIVATILIITMGKYSEHSALFSMILRIVTVIIFMIFILEQLSSVFSVIRDLSLKAQMDSSYLNIILKIIGIAYLAEFGYQLCKDAGEEAIGSKIQFAGKVMIFVISSPVILALVALITELL